MSMCLGMKTEAEHSEKGGEAYLKHLKCIHNSYTYWQVSNTACFQYCNRFFSLLDLFFFLLFFFYKNNNKNDKDNTMGNFMAMLLNGFRTSRWNRCGGAVLGGACPASAWRVSKVTKKTQNVPSLCDDRTLLQHPVHSPTATRGHSSCLWEHVHAPPSSSVHVTNICTWKIRSSVWVFHEYYLYSKNPGDEK